MSVVNGQLANQTTFNNAFMSRTGATTQTVAQVALENTDVVSGAFVNNIQRAINKAFEGVGASGEADANINNYSSTNYITNGDNRKVAVGKLDAQLKITQDEVDLVETDLSALGSRVTNIESNPSTFGGNKTFSNNVIVQGDLTVNGTTTTVNSTVTELVDPSITLNNNGNDATSEGAGIEIERTAVNAKLEFENALASKFKIGLVGSLREIIVNGVAQIVGGIKDFTSGIKTNVIDESTINAGVTIDTVLIKDGLVDGRDVSVDGADLDTAEATIITHGTRLTNIESNTQTLGGDKTFSGNVIAQNDLTAKRVFITDELFANAQVNTQVGADVQITAPLNPIVKLTGAGLASINRIVAPGSGNKMVFFINQSGADILVKDNNGIPTTNRIRTGTGANVQFLQNAVMLGVYDDATDLWYLTSVGGGAVASTGGRKVFSMKVNGAYPGAVGQTAIDGYWVAPTNCQITNIFIYNEVAGSSGTTELDLKIKPLLAGAFVSVFLTTPKVASTAAANSWCGVSDTVTGCTAPILTTLPFAVAAKSALRLDLIASMGGAPANCGLVIAYEEL